MSGNLSPQEKTKTQVVLYKSKWDKILQHLQREDDVKYASEADRHYKEYLLEESRAMTNKWDNSIKATIKAKEEERLKNERKRIGETADRFKQLKECDEMKCFEENMQAMDTMHKMKMSSRLLESAYMASEYFAVQELQRQANAKSATMKRETELAMGRKAIAQDEQYAEQQKRNISDSIRKQYEYKKELRQFNENNERQQIESKKVKNEVERLERNRIDNELAIQLSKERRILEKKKEIKRIIALEAMQMAEKRRIREEKESLLQDQVVSIFADGNNINQVKKEHKSELAREKDRFYKNKLADIKNIQVKEDDTINRTFDEFQAKLKFKDQAKVEERRRLKQMQIKNHLDDLAREKMREQRKENELKRDIENRIRNDEVNVEFDRKKRLETMNCIKEHRRILNEQMEERKQKDQEKDYSDLVCLREMNAQEDKAFFNYANELVNETIQKSRPIYPLAKVIDEYKHTNNTNSNKLIYGVEELKAMRK